MRDPNEPSAATSSSLDSSYFTDGDQLTAMLVDKRATDTKQRSSFVDARRSLARSQRRPIPERGRRHFRAPILTQW